MWNQWQTKDRTQEIRQEIVTLSSPWVEEERVRVGAGEVTALCQPFLLEEMDKAIEMARAELAPDLNRVDYVMLKKLPRLFKEQLLNIFNCIFLTGEGYSVL